MHIGSALPVGIAGIMSRHDRLSVRPCVCLLTFHVHSISPSSIDRFFLHNA